MMIIRGDLEYESRKFYKKKHNIPKELNLKIEMMKNDYSYSTKSDLIIELLELGIISFYKEKDRDTKIDIMLERLNLLLDKIND